MWLPVPGCSRTMVSPVPPVSQYRSCASPRLSVPSTTAACAGTSATSHADSSAGRVKAETKDRRRAAKHVLITFRRRCMVRARHGCLCQQREVSHRASMTRPNSRKAALRDLHFGIHGEGLISPLPVSRLGAGKVEQRLSTKKPHMTSSMAAPRRKASAGRRQEHRSLPHDLPLWSRRANVALWPAV
jgi:hypothetical protein